MHVANSEEFIEDAVEASTKLFNFKDVIKESTGFEVLPLSKEYEDMVNKIKSILESNLERLSGVVEASYIGRSNELGNFLDGELIKIIDKIPGFHATRPTTSVGKRQSAGYPDIVLEAKDKTIYIETKIYQKKTKESSLRTFYFKPTEKEKIKVNHSCPHILIGFEVESKGENNRSPFLVNDLEIVDLFDLKVNFKPEFNASNPMIYNDCKKL